MGALPIPRYRRFLIALGILTVIGCQPAPSTIAPPTSSPTNAPSSVRFAEVTTDAGVHAPTVDLGNTPYNILQTIGKGGAFLDFDQDGHLDILLIGPTLTLLRGDGAGKFTDVTAPAGLRPFKGHFLGCAVGDIDSDGYPDIYISGYRTGVLLHNEQGRMFRDRTVASGIQPQPWGTSAAFAETVPGSGRLDLYICNYVAFGPDTEQLCLEKGRMTSCGPKRYRPLKGVLYRNGGNGRFSDVTSAVGASAVSGKALGIAFAAFDETGAISAALANDEMPGDLLQNDGKGRFRNVADAAGVVGDRDGNLHAGMGIDWGDFDNDGRLDLFVTTFQGEVKCLYRNEGQSTFTEVAGTTGIAQTSQPFLTFGTRFFDADNDGWLDLMLANGHVQDNIDQIYPGSQYPQSLQFLYNTGQPSQSPRFEDRTADAGQALQTPRVGRGLATGDYDNDGRIDVLVTDVTGQPILLHNESTGAGNRPRHWLGIKLIGKRSNRDGYGATVTVSVGGRTLVRHCHADGSYLSSSDPRLHFGLGDATAADTVTVRWPSGATQTVSRPAVDCYITITEGT
jgi:hypothetical protein